MGATVKERLKEFIKVKGLSVYRFEQICGLSTGYVSNMRVSIQPDKIESIAHNFPDLNTGWLLTGEGAMLKSSITQNAQGDNNTQVAGNGNSINSFSKSTHDNAISEIAEQRKLEAKAQEQIDRLLTLLENRG